MNKAHRICGRVIFGLPEFSELLYSWYTVPFWGDGFMSGVLADYIEDRLDEFLELGNDMSDLKIVVRVLRVRFNNINHNHLE